jgi:hypothetical protein
MSFKWLHPQSERMLWYCPLCLWVGEFGKLIRHTVYGCEWHCPSCFPVQIYPCNGDRLGCVPSESYSELDFAVALA